MTEIPDLYEMTPEERKKALEQKPVIKRDYFPAQQSEGDSIDPNLLDTLEKEALELIIEHLKRLRYR
ncbi:hypothetical protein MUP79_01670 [Candidatus Bathyarchaeota archaeon]|nr:hypothetical protein [Candidatus Bathyarchaeota archaeon]